MTVALVCGNEARLMTSTENVIGMWDHLVLEIGLFDDHMIDLSEVVLEPPRMVRIVPWVGNLSLCCGSSRICSGGGRAGLGSDLFCGVLYGIG
jgi:hypothetical protein